MADVTFTLTVPGGAAGGFYVDGVQRDTLSLDIGKTYRFDDSDASCTGNRLAFSTTPDGTHNGGTFYNTGTTRNNSPGQPGAYVEIIVTASTPSTLYYFSIDNSGMGGLINTDLAANSWGSDLWGQYWWNLNQDFNTGWNTKTWGSGSWGNVGDENVVLTGQEISVQYNPSVTITAEVNIGWGGQTWGTNNWGDLSSVTISVSGVEITSTLNDSLDISGNALLELNGQESVSYTHLTLPTKA